MHGSNRRMVILIPVLRALYPKNKNTMNNTWINLFELVFMDMNKSNATKDMRSKH